MIGVCSCCLELRVTLREGSGVIGAGDDDGWGRLGGGGKKSSADCQEAEPGGGKVNLGAVEGGAGADAKLGCGCGAMRGGLLAFSGRSDGSRNSAMSLLCMVSQHMYKRKVRSTAHLVCVRRSYTHPCTLSWNCLR